MAVILFVAVPWRRRPEKPEWDGADPYLWRTMAIALALCVALILLEILGQ